MSDSVNINNQIDNILNLQMVERQPLSADNANITLPAQRPPPTQQEQFQILSQLNLPLSIPPPPAAFQLQQPVIDPLSAQINALEQAQQESLAKLQLLSYQLNSLNMVNQATQTISSLQQYQHIYQEYQLEFTHQMILSQYLNNMKPINCNFNLIPSQQPVEQHNDSPNSSTSVSSQLETIAEGEFEEEEPKETHDEDSDEIVVQMTAPSTHKQTTKQIIGESNGNCVKFLDKKSETDSDFEQIKKQIRTILNKITPENFNKLSVDIASMLKVADIPSSDKLSSDELVIAQKAQFKALIKLILKCILEKAIKETLFSNEYARLCYSLYLFVEASDLKKKIFRQQLLSLCHSVFKNARNSSSQSHEYLGIIAMIGELFIYGLISWNVVSSGIFDQLLPPASALDVEAICKLLKTAGNDFDRHHFAEINLLMSKLKKCANNFDFRTQCLVKEVDEMRQNEWRHKVKQDAPMTLNQLHKEFNKENGKKMQYKSKRNVGGQGQRWRNAAYGGQQSRWHNGRQSNKSYNAKPYKSHYNGKRRGHQQNVRPSVEFVADVTLPDRSHYPASKLLTKTWAMRNSGDFCWGDCVELVYFKGDRSLSLEDRYPVINAVPGQEVEISASIRTPEEPGRYCTYFRLQKNGTFFGPRVWVDLIVRPNNGLGAKSLDGRKNCATNNEGGNGTLLSCQ